ncbi:MAG: 16S rRNA (guanine(527)-N(7))-methyltransferase RsmG [Alphaproteobacteria bacterium]|nr:16S rRNA (guanine(527)-N(7))-methyltransferase RsmG [Alphaproteobacteria bacterium]
MENLSLDDVRGIEAYCELLIKWNAKINLVGRATISEIKERHVLDCIQLSSFINKKESLVDLGSGAGLPGILLSIIGHEDVTLVESDQKKCVFLREVRRALNLKCNILNMRIEEMKDCKYDLVVSRALASLNLLLDFSEPILKEGGRCLFLKGSSFQEEIDLAKQYWSFKYETIPSKTGCGGVILEVQNIIRY